MRKFLISLILLCSLSVFGANPSFVDTTNIVHALGVANLSRISSAFGTNSLGGDMSNSTPSTAYIPAITQQGGLSAIWIPASTTQGDYKHRVAFPAGIQSIGDPNGLNDPNFGSMTVYVGYGTNYTNGSSDTLVHAQSGATSPNNSGTGFNVNVMGIDPVTGGPLLLDSVGASFMHVPTNRITSLIPGWTMVVMNSGTNNRGLSICSPGISGFDSGNYSLILFDIRTPLVHFPKWVSGKYQPWDSGYKDGVIYDPKTGKFIITTDGSLIATNVSYFEGGLRIGSGASGGGGQPTIGADGLVRADLLTQTNTATATNYVALKTGSGTVGFGWAGGSGIGLNTALRFLLSGTQYGTLDVDKFRLDVAGMSFMHVNGVLWRSGSGSPEGVITAPIGSLYSRSDGGAGTSLYVKESGSGNTGWVGK